MASRLTAMMWLVGYWVIQRRFVRTKALYRRQEVTSPHLRILPSYAFYNVERKLLLVADNIRALALLPIHWKVHS